MNFNKAFILGNLTRDPESRMLPSGQPVVSFGIATNRVFTDRQGNKQQQVEFHNIVAFGKLADICARYLAKGRLVFIEGRIQNRSWQGQDGVKRNRTEIIAENMQMGPRQEAGVRPSEYRQPSPPVSSTGQVPQEEIPIIETEDFPEEQPQNEETPNEENKGEIKVENIPF